MEVAVDRPPVKEEMKRAEAKPEFGATMGSSLPIVFESFQSAQRDAGMKHEDSSKRIEATKAEMGEVREENERLKTLLSRIVGDYQSLHMHFLDVVKVHEQAAKTAKPTPAAAPPSADNDNAAEADDLVSLSLGTRSNGGACRKGHERSLSSSGGTTAEDEGHQLSLGLGFARGGGRLSTAVDDDKAASCRDSAPMLNLSSDSSTADDVAKPAAYLTGDDSGKSPSGRAGARDGADDEVQQQQAKKARVSVRVKCDTPTMNDGCQWRKYGQKISKGNPCPRAYYRCTVAPNCPVRKQVQRCAEDTTILITTYEGAHSHPLPPAATAMASTTSAAAAMLTSGSTTSSHHHHHHLPLSFGPTTMVSTAASCPTITLDLTAPAAPHHALGLMHSSPYESKTLPAAWSSGYPAYGQQQPYYARSSPAMMGHLFGTQSRPEQLYAGAQSYLQKAAGGVGTDTLAKAITSDPSFQSALAAVITSYMRRGSGGAAAHK